MEAEVEAEVEADAKVEAGALWVSDLAAAADGTGAVSARSVTSAPA